MAAQFIRDPNAAQRQERPSMELLFSNLGANLQRRRAVEDRKEADKRRLERMMAKGDLPAAEIDLTDEGYWQFKNADAKKAFYAAIGKKDPSADLSREADGEITEEILPDETEKFISRAQEVAEQDTRYANVRPAVESTFGAIANRTQPGMQSYGPGTPELLINKGYGGQQPTSTSTSSPTPTPAPASVSTQTVQGGFGPVTLPASPLTTPTTVPTPVQTPQQTTPAIGVGSRGAAVKALQTALGVKADGAFGPATQAKLKQYQTNNGLAASGELDQATAQKLNINTAAIPQERVNTKTQRSQAQSAGQLEAINADLTTPTYDIEIPRYSKKTTRIKGQRIDEIKEGLRSLAGAAALESMDNAMAQATGYAPSAAEQNLYKNLYDQRLKQIEAYEKASTSELPMQEIKKQEPVKFKVTGGRTAISTKEAAKQALTQTFVDARQMGGQQDLDKSQMKMYAPSAASLATGKSTKADLRFDPSGFLIYDVANLRVRGTGGGTENGQPVTWFASEKDAQAAIERRLQSLAQRYGANYQMMAASGKHPGNESVITRGGQPIGQFKWNQELKQRVFNPYAGSTPLEISEITGEPLNSVGTQEEIK